MKAYQTTLLLAALATASFSQLSYAQGFYGTAMAGKGSQITDSEAYGNNIAVDPDFPNDFSTGDGKIGTLGLGYSFNSPLRIEGRISSHKSDFNSRRVGTGARAGEEYILDGDIKSRTLTVEGFYDIPTGTGFKPYVKAGVGASRNHYSARLGGTGVAGFDAFDGTVDGYYDAYDDKKSTELTWNVGVGASVALNKRINLVGEYQYVSFGDAKTDQDSFTDGFQVDDAAAHEVQLGIQAKF